MKGRKGNTFVEFALAATLILPIFCGVFQYGYTFYVYNSLVNAVRDGMRYASFKNLSNSSGNGVTPQSYSDAVANVVVYGSSSPASGTPAVVPNLTTSNVLVTVTYDSAYVPTAVSVKIQNFTVDGIFGSTTFNKPVLSMPYLGTFCSYGSSC